MGLGRISLWPVVSSRGPGMVLGPRPCLGTGMGELEALRGPLWLGAAATDGAFCPGERLPRRRPRCEREFRLRPLGQKLRVYPDRTNDGLRAESIHRFFGPKSGNFQPFHDRE